MIFIRGIKSITTTPVIILYLIFRFRRIKGKVSLKLLHKDMKYRSTFHSNHDANIPPLLFKLFIFVYLFSNWYNIYLRESRKRRRSVDWITRLRRRRLSTYVPVFIDDDNAHAASVLLFIARKTMNNSTWIFGWKIFGYKT